MGPDAVEIRVLGCLLEKQRTTPDVYPLSLNALRAACNQSSSRDPVASYEEDEVLEAVRRLTLRGWVRLASGAGSRARKYRHLLGEALGLDADELSLIAVLLLRGIQTPGELKQRSERLYEFADLGSIHETLDRLVERGHVVRHERRPGQKEERYEQRLGDGGGDGGGQEEEAVAPAAGGAALGTAAGNQDEAPGGPGEAAGDSEAGGHGSRLERLEADVAELRAQITALREALGE